jgi:hypothetical protein
MDAHEIVIHHVERDGVSVVLYLLGKCRYNNTINNDLAADFGKTN